jgi:N-acetylglucosaminyldiphosphoundecaprenol N-acetyl-beta-D-mannosaminyltransferase
MSDATLFRPYELLGARVHAMTLGDLFDDIARAIDAERKWVVGYHNLHSLYLYHHDAAMRRYCDQANRIFIDGMGLVFAARLAGLPIGRQHRSTSVDWLMTLTSLAAARGWRVFLLGSRPGVAARAAEALRSASPNLQIDVAHGYFDMAPTAPENEAVLARIRGFQPSILIVGMGMPRQEQWVVENRHRIDAAVILNLGAIFDYLGGEVPTPPRWMSRIGLEWLGRLVIEPRRLWRRYLVEPWSLLPLLLRDLIENRKAADVDRRADVRL